MVPMIEDRFDSLIDAGVVDQQRIIASFMRHKADFTQELPPSDQDAIPR